MALVSKNFADIITFTRASAGWHYNSAGVLVQAASNAPRFDYDPVTKAIKGLLIEEQRTNKCTNTNANPTDLTGVTKIGDALATLALVQDVAALAAAGLGTLCSNGNVYKLDNSAGSTLATAQVLGAVANLNTHSGSVFVRGSGSADVRINGGGTAVTLAAAYVRTVVANQTPSDTTRNLFISANPGAIVYFILNQLEEGGFATSPIVTAGAQVTRAADVASVNTLSPWFRADEGTLFVEALAIGQAGRFISLNDGTANNRIVLHATAADTSMIVVSGGVTQATGTLQTGVATSGATLKMALAYKANDFAGSSNGAAVVTDSSGTIPPVTCLTIGADYTVYANTHIRDIQYLPKRLSNSELQALTA